MDLQSVVSVGFWRCGGCVALAASLCLSVGHGAQRTAHPGFDGHPRAVARQSEVESIIRAGGQVESTVHTVIRCTLENLSGRTAATSILELAPEGSIVAQGDVICRLDASAHEEMERLQEIAVAQGCADQRRAQLDLEVAITALDEYQAGLSRLESQAFEGRLALAQAQVVQSSDRLDWSRRMLAKSYISRAQAASAGAELDRARFTLAQVQTELRNFHDYQVPRTILELQSRIESARSRSSYEAMRLRGLQERLHRLRAQVDACTIRAPHDGLLIYAHKPKRDLRIEPGVWVHQNQSLLYLPDLSRLEVQVLLHETVVRRVRPGMRASIRLEASGATVSGRLSSIDTLPVADRSKRSSGEVKYFIGRVRLDDVSVSLLPGMTAEVQILTDAPPRPRAGSMAEHESLQDHEIARTTGRQP